MNIQGINVLYSFLKHKELTKTEVFLLSLLNDIGANNHIPNNSILAKVLNTSKANISKTIKSLILKGFLEKENTYTDIEVFEILTKGATYKNGCTICGYSKSTLDEHHYPIRAKDGGTETIKICANCHREFHELADFNRHLQFTKKTKGLL